MAVEAAFQSRAAGTPPAGMSRHVLTPADSDGEPALTCSVGIMAYNEERNIASSINAVLAQEMTSGEIAELIVVASGCSDRTTDIVVSLARDEPRLHLVVEEQRAGKASAINEFIANTFFKPLLIGTSVLRC